MRHALAIGHSPEPPHVERVERLAEERKAIGADIKDIYAEAKSAGFDVAVLRQLIRIRAQEAAEVEVVEEVRVTRVWAAVDAGLVINPDGAENQIEGGIIQATSWALKEAVQFDADGITSRSWATGRSSGSAPGTPSGNSVVCTR